MAVHDSIHSALSFLRNLNDPTLQQELLQDETAVAAAAEHRRLVGERVRRRGLDLEAIFAEDSRRLEDYPGPHCLLPNEIIELLQQRVLMSNRHEHIVGCVFCRAALQVAEPRPARLALFLDELRDLRNLRDQTEVSR